MAVYQGAAALIEQKLWGYKTGVAHNQWENLIFAQHTHCLELNIIAQAGSNNSASWVGIFNTHYGASVVNEISSGQYGPGTQRITDITARYLNSGGSQSYIIQVYLTDASSTGETSTISWMFKGFAEGNINNIS